jgi:hypothetical protein
MPADFRQADALGATSRQNARWSDDYTVSCAGTAAGSKGSPQPRQGDEDPEQPDARADPKGGGGACRCLNRHRRLPQSRPVTRAILARFYRSVYQLIAAGSLCFRSQGPYESGKRNLTPGQIWTTEVTLRSMSESCTDWAPPVVRGSPGRPDGRRLIRWPCPASECQRYTSRATPNCMWVSRTSRAAARRCGSRTALRAYRRSVCESPEVMDAERGTAESGHRRGPGMICRNGRGGRLSAQETFPRPVCDAIAWLIPRNLRA